MSPTETLDLTFADAQGRPVDVPALRGSGRAVALFFMRAASCAVCVKHARSLAALGLADRGVAPVVVVPGGAAELARARRAAGAGVTVVSSGGVDAHRAAGLGRTLMVQHSGTLLVDATGAVRYRLAGTLPTGSFDAAALTTAVDRL
jgi:peroxiredoxin